MTARAHRAITWLGVTAVCAGFWYAVAAVIEWAVRT